MRVTSGAGEAGDQRLGPMAGVTGGAKSAALPAWGRVRAFLGRLVGALRAINLTALAAQVAYSLIFAFPSILLILALVARTVDERTGFAISDEVRAFIVGALPAGVQPVVTGLVDEATRRAREGPTTLSAALAVVVALVAAGGGLGELVTAFDEAAGIEDGRSAWVKRFVFTLSAVLIAMVLVVAFALSVWGGGLLDALATRFGLGGGWRNGWQWLQGPFILLLVLLGTTLLYISSSGRSCVRQSMPGAAVATLVWLLLVKGFQLYLQIANPGSAYGAASSLLVFLIFLYLSSAGLIVGAMSAAVIVRETRQPGPERAAEARAFHG